MRVFDFFHQHRRAILFTVVVFTISGIAVMLNMPVSLFPDVTFPRIVILADNGDQPAERMMVEVTKPLEEVISSIPGVKYVRSKTSRGSTEISVGLDWGSNVLQTLQFLQGRISNIRNELPASASIQAEQMTVAIFPIAGYSLTSDSVSLVELRDIALYQMRPALMRVNGVAKVEIGGGDTREFLVKVSPEKLLAYHISIQQVSDAIKSANFVESTGLIDNNYQLYLSLVSGLLKTTTDIGSVVVNVQNHVPVRVSDVAQVTPSVADKFIRTTAHGRDAVLINILKQPTGSTVQIRNDVTKVINSLKLPAGVHFENFYDQGNFIANSIRETRNSILIGIALAMGVLVIFLGSWRLTIVIALVVPATIASTFLLLAVAGKTINIMTLGGIAAAVGLIIDDSIVIIEYIFSQFAEHKQDGYGRGMFLKAASTSLRDLMPAIVGSTASTIVIQIPLAFLGGVAGAFFTSLSITMVFAMAISFILSISFAPLLASVVLKEKDIRTEVERERHSSRLIQWYARTLRRLLRYRYAAIPAALLTMGLAYLLYQHIGSSFMPDMDEGAFILDYKSPPGTSLTETNRMLMHVEQILLSTPEVESYSRRTGTELGFFMTEPNKGDFAVKLKQKRSRNVNEVIDEVRNQVERAEPGLQINFGQLMMDVIGDLTNSPAPIDIKIFGDDVRLLHEKAKEVKRLIETVPGVVDAFDGIVISGPSFVIHVDPLKASLAGFSAAGVKSQVDNMMMGTVETKVQKGEKLIGIHVRYPDAYRMDVQKIEQLQLVNSNGIIVPLRNMATIEKTSGQAEIAREQLRQYVGVTARISGRDLGSTVADIQKKLNAQFTLPTGMRLEYGGVYQTQQESFGGLSIVAIAAFVLVFIVLVFEFGEFSVPLSILIVNLASLAGVFGALWMTGVTFNISSFVGIIMIIGIVAENAIFVIHMVKMYRSRGESLDEALVKASIIRIRPILMTTFAAVCALLPLALGVGAGSQMQQPLAIAVIGGFSMSSLLLFFGLPMLYSMLKRG